MVVSTLITALIAFVFELEKLVEIMNIGTLLAYTIVSASVIILRYKPSMVTYTNAVTMDKDSGPSPDACETSSNNVNIKKFDQIIYDIAVFFYYICVLFFNAFSTRIVDFSRIFVFCSII